MQGAGAGPSAGLAGDFAALRFLPGPEMVETARSIVASDQPLTRMALGMGLLDQIFAGLSGDHPSRLAVVAHAWGRELHLAATDGTAEG